MAGAPDEHMEERLNHIGHIGRGVAPFAECAGAVAGEVIAAEGDSRRGRRTGRRWIKAAVEDRCNVGTEYLFAIGKRWGRRIVVLSAEIGCSGKDWIGVVGIGCGELAATLRCRGLRWE